MAAFGPAATESGGGGMLLPMPSDARHLATEPASVIVWCDEATAGRAGELLARMGASVRVVAVGGPRASAIGDLAQRCSARAFDDRRQMARECPASFLLHAAAENLPEGEFTPLRSQGCRVLAVEPVADDLDDAPDPSAPAPLTLPAFLRAPGWSAAADPIAVLGRLRSASILSLGPPAEASLFSRLFDAWSVALTLVELPESIDAAYAGPLPEPPPPEAPRGLTGDIALLARASTLTQPADPASPPDDPALERSDKPAARRSALTPTAPGPLALVMQISDRAGASLRRVQLTGSDAALVVSDHHYSLHDRQGRLLDQLAPAPVAPDYLELSAIQWRRLIAQPDRPIPPGPPVDAILACCQACLLSARTGQPESPRKMLEIHGRRTG